MFFLRTLKSEIRLKSEIKLTRKALSSIGLENVSHEPTPHYHHRNYYH